jgi:glycine/D-amino acid oxidase-like deaminating enzyme
VERFDAVVVGAGPAGALTAYHLSRARARVLLVDKASFPRDKPCGGGLTYRALRQLPFSVEPVVEDVVSRVECRLHYRRSFERGDRPLAVMTQRRRLDAFLAERAVEAGAEIVECHPVQSIDELEGDRVLVATDGYPSGLLGQLEGLIVPTRGQMIATEPVAEPLFLYPHYGRHGFDYWQQVEDGRILAGGFRDADLTTEFTAEERTTSTIQDALEQFLSDLVGRRLQINRRWAGIFGLVLDFLPVVGRVPGQERVWVSAGYSGHGNVLGFMCGDLVAKAMLGDAWPGLTMFEPARLLTGFG